MNSLVLSFATATLFLAAISTLSGRSLDFANGIQLLIAAFACAVLLYRQFNRRSA